MTEETWVELFGNHVRLLRPSLSLQCARAIGLQQWARYREMRTPESAAIEWDKESRAVHGIPAAAPDPGAGPLA